LDTGWVVRIHMEMDSKTSRLGIFNHHEKYNFYEKVLDIIVELF